MKKVLDYRCYISLDGNYYADTSLRHHLTYTEPKMDKLAILITFDDLVRAVKDGMIMNAEITHTLFRRKPMVKLFLGWDSHYVTARNYKPIYVKRVWEKPKEQKSISTLADLLPAEEFVEYVIDKGLSCVNIK